MKEQWIRLHIDKKLSIPEISKLSGYHENTLYTWKAKYQKGGKIALVDESKAPKHHTNEYTEDIKDKIRLLRAKGLKDEKRYLGPKVIAHRLKTRHGIEISESGIGKFLHNDGLIPEQHKRRRPKKERVKKCKIHEPGELVQYDVKYALKSYAGYWFYEYDAIDYVTGVTFGEIYEIQSNLETVIFANTMIKRSPFSIKGIQTDNHATFTNYYTGYKKSMDPMKPRLHSFDILCMNNNITHYLIDPGKPAQNGKIERFHRTVEEEMYQTNTFKDLNSLRKKFRDYLYYYNNEREHQGLNMMTPVEKLQSFKRYQHIKAIT